MPVNIDHNHAPTGIAIIIARHIHNSAPPTKAHPHSFLTSGGGIIGDGNMGQGVGIGGIGGGGPQACLALFKALRTACAFSGDGFIE